ncbi:MAG: 30S ribosomal protein S6 [Desulfomonilaceae bacterium]
MRRYESVVILDPEMPDDDIRSFTEKYSQLIKTNGGEIIKIEDWGFKRLAYLVKKKEKGRYILFDFVGLPALITELERQFKISEEVMKFLSVKLDDDVDLEAFKAEAEEKAAAAAAATAAAQKPVEPAPAEPAAPAPTEEAAEPTEEPIQASNQEAKAVGTEEAAPGAETEVEPTPAAAQTEEAPASEQKEGE